MRSGGVGVAWKASTHARTSLVYSRALRTGKSHLGCNKPLPGNSPHTNLSIYTRLSLLCTQWRQGCLAQQLRGQASVPRPNSHKRTLKPVSTHTETSSWWNPVAAIANTDPRSKNVNNRRVDIKNYTETTQEV